MPDLIEMDEFAPVKAVKAQVKLKLGVSGPSGSGKTDGALALATLFGSVESRTKKPRILLIDTENRSASLYADRYEFDTIPLKAPYTPERYKKAMQKAIEGNYDWLIVDTISHEWEAEGGILRKKEKMDLQPATNSFTNWGKLMPDHEAFVEFLKQIPVHTICTMRSKQAYVLETDGKGKQKPRKLGMEPIQRPGVEYEFTLIFDLDMTHNALPSKNRTTLFDDDPQNLRDPEVAQKLRGWLEAGAVVTPAEWKPELGTINVGPLGERSVSRAPDARTPAEARPPLLIDKKQKAAFWMALRDAEPPKTDEQVKQWLYQRFKVNSSAEIPADSFKEAMEWAKAPLAPVNRSPEEKKAREAAAALGVAESDLQFELEQAKGDWMEVYGILNARADAEAAILSNVRAS